MNLLLVFIIAAGVSLALIPPATRLAGRLGLLDQPTNRKVHLAPIPRTGGWGIVAGAMVPMFYGLSFDAQLASCLVAVLVLFVFGLWDDAANLNHRIKFVGQIIAASTVVLWGDIYVSRLPFMDGALLPEWLARPFSIFALVGVINAVNHSDGLDGLAGGECLLSLGALLALLLPLGGAHDAMAVLACATLGSTFAFLRYNRHPARVFMGDTGSQFLGFTLGVLVIHLSQFAERGVTPSVALLLIGMPVFDILVTLGLRISSGMSWFAGSRNHIHHRLLDRGLSHYAAVGVLYGMQALLVTSGYLLHQQSDAVLLTAYGLICGGALGALVLAEKRGWIYARGIEYHRA
jgi:UDP-GlcNAc:undecaprenyl-phosphate GlcNAc-1-phosphate transferase